MTTQQIADRLVALCREGNDLQVHAELYGDDIVSIEPFAPPGRSAESVGIAAVKAKGAWWYSAHTVNSSTVDGPLVSDAHFCVRFHYDVTQKASGNTIKFSELAVYQVKDGKIVREQFFYAM
jgi:ketosteroid isomerase-like protein